ncbi:MAG: class I SAM-dependent methyltransferase [Deltaproteobacteria bacterium]|nr:class I SAM-dependent methyltransferase [Deltaproteobacteria bacterium]
MRDKNNRVCPVERAGSLDIKIRRWVQDPWKILHPYIREGMTVLDFGCGPGYFSIDIAQMVGKSGRVIAADLQEGMLDKLKEKIRGKELEELITLHLCKNDNIGLSDRVDFALAFYVVHEISNQEEFFKELFSILKPGGKMLVVEPPFHVSKRAFGNTCDKARNAGFKIEQGPRLLLNKTALLKKA